MNDGKEVEFTYKLSIFHSGKWDFGRNLSDWLVLAACAEEGKPLSLYGRLSTGKSGHQLKVEYVKFDGLARDLTLEGKPLQEVWDSMF